MEKVNIRFHDNYTVSYQHKKILEFVPELSADRDIRITSPNIPLLVILIRSDARRQIDFKFPQFLSQTLSMQVNDKSATIGRPVSWALSAASLVGMKLQPFVSVTVNELLFGYEDTLVSLANTFYPRDMRPAMSKMGLLIEVSPIRNQNPHFQSQIIIVRSHEYV